MIDEILVICLTFFSWGLVEFLVFYIRIQINRTIWFINLNYYILFLFILGILSLTMIRKYLQKSVILYK